MQIEGRNAVKELIDSDKTVDVVFVQNGMRDAASRSLLSEIRASGAKISFVDKSVMDSKSSSGRHQGFIAITSDFEYTEIEDVLDGLSDGSIIVVCDGVEDVHNLGSIVRSAECAGAAALIIGKHRSAQVNDAVMRISEGSASHLPIVRVTNINRALEDLAKAGVWIYALETGGKCIYDCKFSGKIAIVVGGEDTGVNRLTKTKCDEVISIPMFGKINSLNASVAAAIAVFEAVRQMKI